MKNYVNTYSSAHNDLWVERWENSTPKSISAGEAMRRMLTKKKALLIGAIMGVMALYVGVWMVGVLIHENFHLLIIRLLGGDGRIILKAPLFMSGEIVPLKMVPRFWLVELAGGLGTGTIFLTVWFSFRYLWKRKLNEGWAIGILILLPILATALSNLIYSGVEVLVSPQQLLFQLGAGLSGLAGTVMAWLIHFPLFLRKLNNQNPEKERG